MEFLLHQMARLWQRFEDRATKKENWVRIIYRENRPLIVRYYLCSTRWIDDIPWLNWLRSLSFNVVIHHMHESDDDGLHDHPWNWCSFVLSGGYFEETPTGRHWRWPGHLRFRSANSFHRLVLDPNLERGCWTIFIMGPRKREWGFLDRDAKWVPWYEHIVQKQEKAV